MTLAAMDALEADAATRRIIVISKPPAPAVAEKIVARAKRSRKPVTLCLLGAAKGPGGMPSRARWKPLRDSLLRILRATRILLQFRKAKNRNLVRGLFCGGTLCAEAQIVLADHGLVVASNFPVPGARGLIRHGSGARHRLLDLGADEYTRGRPHPMIEPQLRNEHLARALKDRGVGVILLDVVIGYGAHADPAGLLVEVLKKNRNSKLVIASVTGTEGDPQVLFAAGQDAARRGRARGRFERAAARLAAWRPAAADCAPRYAFSSAPSAAISAALPLALIRPASIT